MIFLLPKDLRNAYSETMNTRDTKQTAKPPMQTCLAFPIKNIIGTEDFFYILIKWLYLFWEFPGLSMTVTDLFHKLIYFITVSAGTCVFIPVGFLVFFLFSFSHITSEKFLSSMLHLEVARTVKGPWYFETLFMFSAANIPFWDCPCLEYSLAISVVAFTKIKSTSACFSLGKGWWAAFWQLYIKCRWLHECTFCLAQNINHNPQFLPKELEWIKLFNKTLLTWINSFLFCIWIP